MEEQEPLTLQDVDEVTAHAVDWWVSAIGNQNGETTQEQIQDFKSYLSSEISVGLARTGYIILRTDYYPQDLLAEVAYRSSVKGTAFPQKTFMDISPREVGVRQNHGTRELLFAVKKLTTNAIETKKNIDPITNA